MNGSKAVIEAKIARIEKQLKVWRAREYRAAMATLRLHKRRVALVGQRSQLLHEIAIAKALQNPIVLQNTNTVYK